MPEICYMDEEIVVCIKPARVLSTDEPGGLPELLRRKTGAPEGDFRTVHRLDRVVSGLMVLARSAAAASELSRQVRQGEFEKTYLAVTHGIPGEETGTLIDLLGRDKARRMTFVSPAPGKGIQEAKLDYTVLEGREDCALVRVRLHTGRTHQIRVQFASRSMPLFGERKYFVGEDDCELALYSHQLGFFHPTTKRWMHFVHCPREEFPWDQFETLKEGKPHATL